MSETALELERIGKQYHIGRRQSGHRSTQDVLKDALLSPFRRTMRLLEGRAAGAADLDETFWALKDVSFEVKHGEIVGIIGRNGAGKSTLLKILSRITEPTEGRGEIHGRVGSLLEVGTGFHPELSGRENLFLNGAILGMRKAEIERKFDEIVTFAEIDRFIDTPVKHYSSGMYVRLAFAVAAHLEPEILLVDEVLAVGDAAFQNKCLGKMSEVSRAGRTVVFISHNMAAVENLCDRGILLENGRLTFSGDMKQTVEHYLQGSAVGGRPFQIAHH
jgi:lipopolysaccharide transport system ATP-binding protein